MFLSRGLKEVQPDQINYGATQDAKRQNREKS